MCNVYEKWTQHENLFKVSSESHLCKIHTETTPHCTFKTTPFQKIWRFSLKNMLNFSIFLYFTGRRARLLIASAWGLSFTFALPSAFLFHEENLTTPFGSKFCLRLVNLIWLNMHNRCIHFTVSWTKLKVATSSSSPSSHR